MSEEGNGAVPQQAPQLKMQVLGQFIRDLSFENVVAQKGLASADVQPDIQVQVSLDGRARQLPNQFEVYTKIKATSVNKADKAPLFLVELDYGGIFHIEGVPEDQLHPFLMIECPRLLFPFMRRIISDITRDGGFPALNLDTIDFVQLYRQEATRRAAAQSAGAQVLS